MAKGEDELAVLATLSPAALKAEWQRVVKTPPPVLPPALLRGELGYRIQVEAHARSATAAAKALGRLSEAGAASLSPAPTPALRPGTRLVRSWQGRTLSVLVVDNGFLFEERVYASLTRIACEVTNSNRSGPRFFGLTGHG